MRFATVLAFWLSLWLIPVPAAQTSASQPLKVVDRAIEALGGRARLDRLKIVDRQGVGLMADPTQGFRPIAADEQHPPILEVSRRRVVIDLFSGRAATEATGTIFGGQPYSTRTLITSQGTMTINELKRTISGGALPANAPASPLHRLPRIYPEVLLAQAAASPDALVLGEPTTFQGRSVDVVRMATGPMAVALLIDRSSGWLVGQLTTSTRPGISDTTTIEYDEWREVAGLRLPFVQRTRRNGVVVDSLELGFVRVDEAVDESVFNVPAEFESRPAASPAAEPGVKPLAPDVYLLERAYNSVAVVMADFVVLLEAPIGPIVSDTAIRTIERIAPGKPIRYVVATHFHGDHLGGVGRFVEAGASIVTTADAAAVLTMRMPAAKIEVVQGRRSINDNTHSIDLYQVGPNPHAASILIAYLPKQRLLFEADLLDLDGSTSVPGVGGNDTRALADRLDALRLDVQLIVPVHGHAGTIEDLRRVLRLR